MKCELRRATPEEEEECWDAEAPVWGNGDPVQYREQWKEHQGGDYWLLLIEQTIATSVCFFQSPRFGLPTGSFGMASLLTRRDYRNQGCASFLMSRLLARVYRGLTVYAWSEIGSDFYTQRGWHSLYMIGDAILVQHGCRALHPIGLQRF